MADAAQAARSRRRGPRQNGANITNQGGGRGIEIMGNTNMALKSLTGQ